MTVDNGATESLASVAHLAQRSWSTDGGDYSAGKFYVTTADEKSQAKQLRVYLPLSLLGEIEAIIQQRRVSDYRTAQDFVRDACFHRLEFLRGVLNSPTLEQSLSTYAGQAKIEAQTRRAGDTRKFVTAAVEALRNAADNEDELAPLVEIVEEQLRSDRTLNQQAREDLKRAVAQAKGRLERG